MNVDPGSMSGNTIANFRELNRDSNDRNYLQVSFEDTYIRFTEDSLHHILYAMDDKQRRNDMIAVFGPKKDCRELVYALFIERTSWAKTTVSMETAAGMPFFENNAPEHLDIITEFYLGPEGTIPYTYSYMEGDLLLDINFVKHASS